MKLTKKEQAIFDGVVKRVEEHRQQVGAKRQQINEQAVKLQELARSVETMPLLVSRAEFEVTRKAMGASLFAVDLPIDGLNNRIVINAEPEVPAAKKAVKRKR